MTIPHQSNYTHPASALKAFIETYVPINQLPESCNTLNHMLHLLLSNIGTGRVSYKVEAVHDLEVHLEQACRLLSPNWVSILNNWFILILANTRNSNIDAAIDLHTHYSEARKVLSHFHLQPSHHRTEV